jgi:ribosome-associated toxin RatA of RatAB toxin-antitoxin module
MAGAAREEIFNVSAEQYYKAVTDFKNYPKILPEVGSINIKSESATAASIEYSVNVIKTFHYTLKMALKSPTLVSWELEDGSLFKKNSGRWTITPMGPSQCKVDYNLEVEIKIFAPKSITNALVAVNLPRMMTSFYEHAKTL